MTCRLDHAPKDPALRLEFERVREGMGDEPTPEQILQLSRIRKLDAIASRGYKEATMSNGTRSFVSLFIVVLLVMMVLPFMGLYGVVSTLVTVSAWALMKIVPTSRKSST